MQEGEKKLRVVLAGNPNCGKTTLFNRLTGDHQYVGNWPGVTVEKKTGGRRVHGVQLEITDLPGVYSLTPNSPEEMIADRLLQRGEMEVVIDVVDATNLERNLYLTMQLLERRLPVVVALNLMDELRREGGSINRPALEKALGVPIIPISAATGEGMEELLSGVVHRGEMSSSCARPLYPIPAPDMPDYEEQLAKRRYGAAEYAVKQGLLFKKHPGKRLSDRVDAIVMHRFFAIPLFLVLIFLVFYLTFGSVGAFLNCPN